MTDKEKIITNLKQALDKLDVTSNLRLVLINTIEYLQKESISEDFEEALASEWKAYNDRGAATVDALEDNTQELAFAKGFYRGVQWHKEQMMAKAVDAVVSQVPCSNEIILRNPASVHWSYLPYEMNKLGLNKGDKVKVIVIKED